MANIILIKSFQNYINDKLDKVIKDKVIYKPNDNLLIFAYSNELD